MEKLNQTVKISIIAGATTLIIDFFQNLDSFQFLVVYLLIWIINKLQF